MGPIDYVVVEFPGNRMTGEGYPLLVDLVDRGLIRIDRAGGGPDIWREARPPHRMIVRAVLPIGPGSPSRAPNSLGNDAPPGPARKPREREQEPLSVSTRISLQARRE